jgi:hypothetical protein
MSPRLIAKKGLTCHRFCGKPAGYRAKPIAVEVTMETARDLVLPIDNSY